MKVLKLTGKPLTQELCEIHYQAEATLKTLQGEHDRLENFIKGYSGPLSMEYEIDRLQELKQMLTGGLRG